MTDKEIKTHIRRQYYKNSHNPIDFNARGEPRRHSMHIELLNVPRSSPEYNKIYSRIWRAKRNAETS